MVRIEHRDDDGAGLRASIFELLRNSHTSLEEDLLALKQCTSQIQNDGLVQDLAKECGFKLANGRINEHLELYYDIKQGRHSLGYIFKGWNDPGFRIGEVIHVPQSKADSFKRIAYPLLRFCAGNGIVMTVEETGAAIKILLDGVLYSEGFNKATFRKTLDTLNECVEKADDLINKAG
ncbi:MAG: hypothetical protein WCL44_14620 [bacterium]